MRNYNFQTLYAGEFDGKAMYAVYKVENGTTRQVTSMFADVFKANQRAQELGELYCVQWFGR